MNHWEKAFADMSAGEAAYFEVSFYILTGDHESAIRSLDRFRVITFREGSDGGVTKAVRQAMNSALMTRTSHSLEHLSEAMKQMEGKS